jgi:LemA protein
MTWIIIAILVIIILWFFFTYNSLITGRNRSEEAWADIEVQLKRRYDLIPNLVNTVKGYAAHESTAFEKVTEARAKAIGAQGTPAAGQAEGELSGTLKSLFAIAEAYPELKANTNFLSLQTELSDTENKIQAARRFYNGNVRDYNTKLDMSPSNIVGHMFGFQKKVYFDLADNDAAQQPVEVKF